AKLDGVSGRVVRCAMLQTLRFAGLGLLLLLAAPASEASEKETLSELNQIALATTPDAVVVTISGSKAPDFTSFTMNEPFRVVAAKQQEPKKNETAKPVAVAVAQAQPQPVAENKVAVKQEPPSTQVAKTDSKPAQPVTAQKPAEKPAVVAVVEQKAASTEKKE